MTARPLESHISLIRTAALRVFVDSVSMSAMCHVKNDFPFSQKVLCKLSC